MLAGKEKVEGMTLRIRDQFQASFYILILWQKKTYQ
jgi:hypothetical protein